MAAAAVSSMASRLWDYVVDVVVVPRVACIAILVAVSLSTTTTTTTTTTLMLANYFCALHRPFKLAATSGAMLPQGQGEQHARTSLEYINNWGGRRGW